MEIHYGGGINENEFRIPPPSLSNENRKFNIEYYQFVVHGTHETFSKWLQRR